METGDNVERKNLDESVQVGHNTAIKPPQMNAREKVSMFLLRKERGARKEGRETNKEETKK